MRTVLQAEAIRSLIAESPSMPAVVRYYDDFSDSYGQVANPGNSDRWTIRFDGADRTLDFSDFEMEIRGIVKCWCAFVLADLSPTTAYKYLSALKAVPVERIMGLLVCHPRDVRDQWKELHTCSLSYGAFAPVASVLAFLCRFDIGAWGPEWLDLVSQLPLPKVDKYAAVRVGDVFLDVDEEAKIIGHIDNICAAAQARPSEIGGDAIESAAILICSYQFGFRAKQIAMLKLRDIRVWRDSANEHPAVHLTFAMIKQRSGRSFPMVRRVKREWAPIFQELFRRSQNAGLTYADHVFGRTPADIARLLAGLTEAILGRRRTVMDLRHTAAQRLVDAGASEEELAAFMGHSDLNTGLVYFRSSASQAERVNRALGVSAVYQRVARFGHDHFISAKELAELKGDQQIAGVPHGVPITGIGGCSVGQPSCPYNPIMSCYGCPKFMPIADAAIHKQVLEDLREVMKFFYVSSRAERGSPAFQLEQTISTVKAVLSELGAESNELLL